MSMLPGDHGHAAAKRVNGLIHGDLGVDRHRRRQFAVRVDLIEEQLRLRLHTGDDVSAGNETQRRLLESGDGHEGCAELGGVAALPARSYSSTP